MEAQEAWNTQKVMEDRYVRMGVWRSRRRPIYRVSIFQQSKSEEAEMCGSDDFW
jgi:hypothetical protein